MSTTTAPEQPPELRSWLTHLQRQSWELELLITGFSIFLLLKTPKALDTLETIISRELGVAASGLAVYVLGVLNVTVGILIFNLVVHVVLRGVWIGFVGLSSVFPDGIRFRRLGYRPRFIDDLRRRSLDQTRTIILIDQASSSIFSFSFLIAGYVLSAAMAFLIFLILLSITITLENAPALVTYTATFLQATWLLMMILGLIDFVTAGGLKRIKILERPWSRIHRVLSAATLSFVHRPIYYVLATNYRRWVVHTIVLIYLVAVGWLSLSEGGQGFRLLARESTSVAGDNYDTLRQGNRLITLASLPSETVTSNHLRVFVNHDFKDMTVFDAVCGALKKETAVQLFGIRLILRAGEAKEIDRTEQSETALRCLRQLYRFHVGDEIHQPEMLYHRHPNQGEEGLLTWIPVADVTGLSRLRIEKRTGPGEDEWRVYAEIPFFRATASHLAETGAGSPNLP